MISNPIIKIYNRHTKTLLSIKVVTHYQEETNYTLRGDELVSGGRELTSGAMRQYQEIRRLWKKYNRKRRINIIIQYIWSVSCEGKVMFIPRRQRQAGNVGIYLYEFIHIQL